MVTPDPRVAAAASRLASQRRAQLLIELKQLADAGHGDQCIPVLVDRASHDPAVCALHVWLVDQAVFGAGRALACRHIQTAARWTGCVLKHSPARTTVGWLLDDRTHGARLLAWLAAIATGSGWKPDPPDPYHG